MRITWGILQDDRDALLAHLISNNFLSEERYAEAYVSGKVSIKKWGRIKIRLELKRRRISDYSTNKAIDSIDKELYWSNLIHLTEKKFNSLQKTPNSYKKTTKVYRYLSSKGYETDLLKDACAEVLKGN